MSQGWGISPGPVSTSLSRQGVWVCTREDRPKPYTRVTRRKGGRVNMTTAAKAYYGSQARLRDYLRLHILTDDDVIENTNPFKGHPYLFGLAIDVPVGANGEIPANAGDYDNYLKSWLDAITPKKRGGGLARLGLIEDDNLCWYRGPCRMRDIPVQASEDTLWRFHWRIERL